MDSDNLEKINQNILATEEKINEYDNKIKLASEILKNYKDIEGTRKMEVNRNCSPKKMIRRRSTLTKAKQMSFLSEQIQNQSELNSPNKRRASFGQNVIEKYSYSIESIYDELVNEKIRLNKLSEEIFKNIKQMEKKIVYFKESINVLEIRGFVDDY
jgi:hypothetical protein